MGSSVLHSLQRQRAVLRSAADGLAETNSELKAGDSSLRSLYINGVLNKACCYLACAVALLIIAAIFYAHLRSLGKSLGLVHRSPPPPPRSFLGTPSR